MGLKLQPQKLLDIKQFILETKMNAFKIRDIFWANLRGMYAEGRIEILTECVHCLVAHAKHLKDEGTVFTYFVHSDSGEFYFSTSHSQKTISSAWIPVTQETNSYYTKIEFVDKYLRFRAIEGANSYKEISNPNPEYQAYED